MRPNTILIGAILIYLSSFGADGLRAQAPKEKSLRVKFTPEEIKESEAELKKLDCALHYEEIKDAKKPAELAPARRGPVDMVAISKTTVDADLVKIVHHLRRLPKLKVLDFGQNQKVTGKGFKALAALTHLQGLFLDGTSVTDQDLNELAPLKELMWVDLSNTAVTDLGIKNLAKLDLLQSLILNHLPNLTAAGVANLENVTRLRTLKITVEANPKAMTAKVATLKQLQQLTIHPISDAETVEFAALPFLELLDLTGDRHTGLRVAPARPRPAQKGLPRSGDQVTDEGMKALTGCSNLRTLNLSGHAVKVEGLVELVNFKKLEDLNLSGNPIADEGLLQIGKVKTLHKLDLSGTGISNSRLGELSSLMTLETLSVRSNRLGDESIREISRIRSLRELDLGLTRVTCANIRELTYLLNLQKLNLYRTNVTDSALPQFGAFVTLESLDLRGNCPNINADAVKALSNKLSKCKILYDACDALRGGIAVWPGAVGYPFRTADVGYMNPTNPTSKTQPKPLPSTTTPPPPKPPAMIRPLPPGVDNPSKP